MIAFQEYILIPRMAIPFDKSNMPCLASTDSDGTPDITTCLLQCMEMLNDFSSLLLIYSN